jgi:hypothetical protein
MKLKSFSGPAQVIPVNNSESVSEEGFCALTPPPSENDYHLSILDEDKYFTIFNF